MVAHVHSAGRCGVHENQYLEPPSAELTAFPLLHEQATLPRNDQRCSLGDGSLGPPKLKIDFSFRQGYSNSSTSETLGAHLSQNWYCVTGSILSRVSSRRSDFRVLSEHKYPTCSTSLDKTLEMKPSFLFQEKKTCTFRGL